MSLLKETYLDFDISTKSTRHIVNLTPDIHGEAIAFESLKELEGATIYDSALAYNNRYKGQKRIVLITTNVDISTAVRYLHPEKFRTTA